MPGLFWTFRRGILRVALTMACVFVAWLGAIALLEIPLAPWIRSFGLWPTLTGGWQGEVTTTDGRVSFVYLQIEGDVLNPGARSPGRSYIRGTARWCDPGGRIRDYDVWGNPDNWRGSRFHLSTRAAVPRETGVELGTLQGEWNGDRIRASGVLVSHARSASASVSRTGRPADAPEPVQYTLRRGSEQDFLAACAAKG